MSEMNEKLCLKRSVCLRSDTKKRQSMDRFGDDFCEVILSYLSFKDCFRFECVSKQWQRLVYNKQKHLNFDPICYQLMMRSMTEKTVLNSFETIVKKCSNITSIYLYNYSFNDQGFGHLGLQLFNQLFNKFGPNLKTLVHYFPYGYYRYDRLRIRPVLELCPKLKVLDISNTLLSVVFKRNRILVKDLEKICFSYQEIYFFTKMIENNMSLKSIEMRFNSTLSSNELNLIFNGFSKLTKLKALSLHIRNDMNNTNIDIFNEISKVCPNLKKIDIGFHQSVHYENSCQSLKHFKHLTHLEINDLIVDNNFCENIDKHLLQLQVLTIQCNDINGQTLRSLSQLKYIRKIKVYYIKTMPTRKQIMPFVMQIIANCPHIQLIYLTKYFAFRNNYRRIQLNSTDIWKLKTTGV